MVQHAKEHGELQSSDSKLKVTILASEWGSTKGGLSTINRELAIQLAKCPEVEITFFSPQCSEEDKRAALSHNITIAKATRRPGYDELEWLSCPPDNLKIDVIVGHGVKLGRQAQLIRESRKCKWIQVVHTDPEELGMFKSYENPISKGEDKHKIEVELCEMADFVVGVGPKLSEAFRSYLRWCKKDQTVFDFTPGVFNDFVNVEHAAEERKRCGVLVFGRGDAEDFWLKGFDIASKAVAQLNDAHLVFVGAPEGKHEDIAKRLQECGIPANRLKVRSFLQSREDLKRLFCEVDLVLMPSRTEGFGLTGLEALSAGLPVLVSKNSGFGEALHEVPFGSSCVINSEDESEDEDAKVWAEAIKRTLNKGRKVRLQEAEVLRSSYEKKYSWAKQSQDFVSKMISVVHDCQSSSQEKGGLPVSSTTQRTQRMTGEQHTAMSLIHNLHQMQCDANRFNKKTDLSEDLQKIAADKGFIISDNPASGNCMFYALSEQLQSVKGIQTSDRELRKTLVEFLVKYPNLPDGTDLFNFVHGYPSWADYVRGMGKDGTWGDHLILRAAANCYKTRIRVISSLDCDVIITPDHGTVDNTNPLVLGHIHEKHYVSLQPRRGRDLETPGMASSRVMFSSKEESNYAQLCCLLVKMAPNVLRDIFDGIHPPECLKNVLTRDPVRSTLQSLRKKRVINPTQWGNLYPASSSSPVSSGDFDITLLLVLLVNICGLSLPAATLETPEKPLPAEDISREADIARLRYFVNVVHGHAAAAFIDDATFNSYWQEICVTLVRLGGESYGDAIDKLKMECMEPVMELHYKELLKQWKNNDDAIRDHLKVTDSEKSTKRVRETAVKTGDADVVEQTIKRIRQLYRTREERVLPVPWCEDFSFHVKDIFTRLRIVNKEKTRGTLTEEITNMTAIFKAHEECQRPRTVLIEGDPGMGKTTYCQKVAYDWANRQEEWDESFPKIELVLLLRCCDIKSNIWEAIKEQILHMDIDEESKENFFTFVRKNQSKVLLVLDGLDEADPCELPMYIDLVESRVLPECHVILTSRHEVGLKFRRFCDTLWEIVGFTEEDAEGFILKHFKDMKHLAEKLLQKLSHWSANSHLREMTSNPLNAALLCVLCEDFEGDLPTSRTQLYIEIVLCVLRRYEKKKGLSSNNEDLIKVYEEELIYLGRMALNSLLEGRLYIEVSISTTLTRFGFLSVQAAGSRRKPCLRYGFLHKSFQEFFAGFYLASKILSGEIDLNTVVTDKRYLSELKQAFLFMSGIVVSQCEETAVCLVKSIAAHINCLGRCTFDNKQDVISSNVQFAFDCIKECITYKENLQYRLVCTFGSHLDLETLELEISDSGAGFLSDALTVNTTLTKLKLSWKICDSVSVLACVQPSRSPQKKIEEGTSVYGCTQAISVFDSVSFSQALTVNTTLTHLDLSWIGIGDSGAGSLSEALTVNTTLTHLDLSRNWIGDSGAGSLSEALTVNTTLTHLNLSDNWICHSGAGSLSKALAVNTTLTHLDLSWNWLGHSGAGSLSKALAVNTTLTHVDLSRNVIGDSGAGSLSKALAVNTTLTHLDLSRNGIGDSGAGSLSEALTVNTTLTHLDLTVNRIRHSGAGFLSKALTVNTTLTHLNLSGNGIGDSGAGSLSKALKVNTTVTRLNLSRIAYHGAGSLSSEPTVINELLGGDIIGPSGAGFLSDALTVNSTLTHLDLSANAIGESGAGSLSDALTVNTKLTHLDLSANWIGESGASFLSKALTVNTTLTHLDLSLNMISYPLFLTYQLDSGACSLARALTVNNTLTHFNLGGNMIGNSGAGYLSVALAVNTALTHLDLSINMIGDSGAGFLSKALVVNTTLTRLNLRFNRIGPTCRASLSDAQTVNSTCSVELQSQLIDGFNNQFVRRPST